MVYVLFGGGMSNPSTLEKKALNSAAETAVAAVGEGWPVVPASLGRYYRPRRRARDHQEEATWQRCSVREGGAGASGRGTGRGTAGAPTPLDVY
jgi:hypothetical protein